MSFKEQIMPKDKYPSIFSRQLEVSARKLTIIKQHDVSTTSCHHCQMNKLEVTERHIYRSESEKIN